MTDGYPDEDEVEEIRSWEGEPLALMATVKPIWWCADWGWREEDAVCELNDRPVRRFNISTGGWSGNEEIIAALKHNWMFWARCWVSSRRGGHYVFEVPLDALKERTP